MHRRNFFSVLLGTIAAFRLRPESPKPQADLTPAEKEALIARVIQTPEGRRRLAESMYRPIRCGGWDYKHYPRNRPV